MLKVAYINICAKQAKTNTDKRLRVKYQSAAQISYHPTTRIPNFRSTRALRMRAASPSLPLVSLVTEKKGWRKE